MKDINAKKVVKSSYLNMFKQLEEKIIEEKYINYDFDIKTLNNYKSGKIYNSIISLDIKNFFINYIKFCYNIDLSNKFSNKKERVIFEGKFIKYLKENNIEKYKLYLKNKYNFRNYIYKNIFKNKLPILYLTFDDIHFKSIKPFYYYLPKEKKLKQIIKIKTLEKILFLRENKIVIMDDDYNIIEIKNFINITDEQLSVLQQLIYFKYKHRNFKTLNSNLKNIILPHKDYIYIIKIFNI